MKFMGQIILEGVPWYEKIIKTISNRRTCQVAPPPWYKDNPLFKPIKDWTDEELADDHEIVRAKIAADNVKFYQVYDD